MKKILTLLAVAATIGFITPAESSARPKTGARRVITYHHCGAPVYEVYTVYARDRRGNIIDSGWERQPHYCGYSRRGDSRHHHHNHGIPPRRGGFSFSIGR